MSYSDPFVAMAPSSGDCGCGDDRGSRSPAFEPQRVGPANVAGLVQIYERGTQSSPVPPYGYGQERPNSPGLMASTFATYIRPVIGWAQNFRPLIPFAVGGHPRAVPAVRPLQFRARQSPPPPSAPGVATRWPRAILTFPTFGGGSS